MPVVPDVALDRYYLNHEIGDYLRVAEEASPHLRLYTIGTSFEGRPLLMAEITNRATRESHEKPAIWVDGGWRGGQLLGSSAALELIRQLVSKSGHDTVISDLLDHVTFYICPRLAADAGDLSLLSGEWCWSSTRPTPGGPLLGLRPADINGDGRTLQMRQVDPLGEWKISRRDARLMVPRGPDDRQGPFYRLLPEGLLDEGARGLSVAGQRRLELEKNFPGSHLWDSETMGPFPLSEPETRAVADFFRSHANLGIAISFGNLEGGISISRAGGADLPLIRRFARKLQEWTGLPVSPQREPGYLQWLYDHLGLLGICAEPWSLPRAAGLDPSRLEKSLDEPELAGVLRWLDRECPGAFQPWTAFDHPQLGTVELGGWDWLYSWLNPPPGPTIQSESERFVRLVLGVAQSLPRLQVTEFSEETVGWSEFQPPDAQTGDFQPLRKVQLVLENAGYLPTWICQGQQSIDAFRTPELELILEPGQALVLGKAHQPADALAGTGLSELELPIPYYAGGAQRVQRLEKEWLVQGAGRIQVKVRHARAGVHHAHLNGDHKVAVEAAPAPPAYTAPLPPPPPPPPAPAPARSPIARPPAPPLPTAPPLARPAAALAPTAPPARPSTPPSAPVRPAAAAPQPPRPAAPPVRPAQPPAPPGRGPQAAPPTAPLPPAPTPAQPAAGSAPLAAPVEPQRGRVLGSPPPKAGGPISSYAARAQELVQAVQQQRPVTPSSDFEPFSPGLPIRPAYPSGQPARPGVDPPPSVDNDSEFEELPLPPEFPSSGGGSPAPLFLRKREKGK